MLAEKLGRQTIVDSLVLMPMNAIRPRFPGCWEADERLNSWSILVSMSNACELLISFTLARLYRLWAPGIPPSFL